MDMRMAGKVAVITGRASGIGEASAKSLVSHGAGAVSYTHLTLPTTPYV